MSAQQSLAESVSLAEEILEEERLRVTAVNSRWVKQGDLRLDASFYAVEAYEARRALEESGHHIERLGDIVKIVIPPRFKRFYVAQEEGVPLLQGTQIIQLVPQDLKYISRKHTKGLEHWIIQEGWVLVTCSGTIGRVAMARKRWHNWAASQHILRVIPDQGSAYPGYVAAFLSSRYGYDQLVSKTYGAVIGEITENHARSVIIPLVEREAQLTIHEKIQHAYRLRDEASDLLDKAEALLHEELGLPKFSENEAQYLHPEAKVFSTKLGELRLRLDASYHTPMVRLILQKLKKGKYPLTAVGDPKISKRVFIPRRFKRIYVRQKYGVPFLQGTHIVEMKPYDLKYVSKRMVREVEECAVETGWVLVTRSGTVGRVTLVPQAWDEWAVSEHVLRIVPSVPEANSGYIAAFLSSPFGYHQVVAGSYGAVVSEITAEHLSQVSIPLPPREVQDTIGNPVIEAYDKKEEANRIEDEAIRIVEEVIKRGARNER